jgi:hypothetical protein
VRACLSILLERCRGSPKDDEFCPLSILFLYYSQVEDGISALYLLDDSPSCDVDPGVEPYHDDKRQVEDGISALYLFDDAPSCDVYLGVEHHHSDDTQQWGQGILFSAVSTPSPPLPPTAVFGSYLLSLYFLLTLYRVCGLAYPYYWRGVVGAQKIMSSVLLAYYSFIIGR